MGSHQGWLQDIKDVTGHDVNYPIIADHDLTVAKLYNMLPADAGETSDGRTAANNATVRTVYIVGPDKAIKAMLIYPMSSGRNFDEVLRLLNSIQLTAKHSVATPVNWKQGEECIIVPSLSDEQAREKFPGGWEDSEAVSADRPAAPGRVGHRTGGVTCSARGRLEPEQPRAGSILEKIHFAARSLVDGANARAQGPLVRFASLIAVDVDADERLAG